MGKIKFIAHRRKSDGCEQSLDDHLIEVGDLAAQFAEKLGVRNAGRIIGLLHDFGKFSIDFQQYIGSATGVINPDEDDYVDYFGLKGKIDHSSAGAQFIWQQCQRWGINGQITGQILALCIASHHSGLIDCLAPDGRNVFNKRMGKDDDKTHLNESLDNAPKKLMESIESGIDKELIADMINQLMRVARTSDGTLHHPVIRTFNFGFWTRFLFSCLIDADRIDSADFESPDNAQLRSNQSVNWEEAIKRTEAFLAGFQGEKDIDAIRREISDNCKRRADDPTGIYSLTVPTGGGKTYASLRFALHHANHHKLDRIIYIIPFTSIIEQNAEAIRQVIEKETDRLPWVLEHHSNLEPEQQTWHSKLVSENWGAPIVLTTMVQLLEVLFSGGTRGARRFHRLANSVLIFDEIQTLPVNCTHLFCNAINFLTDYSNTTALMCTATQPLLNDLRAPENGQLNIPGENELVPDIKELFNVLKRVELNNKIKPQGWSEEEIAKLALQEFQRTDSCLIIVNTKDWAQRLYQCLQPQIAKDEIFYLSTNLCPQHRKAIFEKIRERLGRKLPILCISTQLIEAGVDVDFGSVIRFLAGLDSIAQAAGRCNRNGLRERSVVYVVNPRDEKIDLLKDIKIGRDKAQRVLSEGFDDMLAPEAMQRYFEYYFFDRSKEMAYPVSKNQIGHDDSLLNLLANNDRNIGRTRNTALLQQSFMTAGRMFKAIDSPTQGVIVPYGEQGRQLIAELCGIAKEFDSGRFRQLLRKAQGYSVNVFPNIWKQLENKKAVHEIQPGEGIYFLDEQYYCDEFGLNLQPCGIMSTAVI